MNCKTCNGSRMIPSWTLCGELDAEACPDCDGTLSDAEIVSAFYPLDSATESQKQIAIAIGRAIAAKALREAAAWMDQHDVCKGAMLARALADRTLEGAA